MADDWRERARCLREGLVDLFEATVDNEQGGHPAERRAKRICSGCPVWKPCLLEALYKDEHGVRGGLSRRERNAALRRRRLLGGGGQRIVVRESAAGERRRESGQRRAS